MTEKTFQDFFGPEGFNDYPYISFNADEIFEIVTGSKPSSDEDPPSTLQLIAALIAHWHSTNYQDADSNTRFTSDKNIPFAATTSQASRRLVTREGETQVQHSFSFNIYTKDTSEFTPTQLVGTEENQPQLEEPPEGFEEEQG